MQKQASEIKRNKFTRITVDIYRTQHLSGSPQNSSRRRRGARISPYRDEAGGARCYRERTSQKWSALHERVERVWKAH